jgi:hypothetical protein
MTITVLNQAAPTPRPTSIGARTITTDYETVYTFTLEDFTTLTTPVYSHPNNSQASFIKIMSLPSSGILELNQNQAGALQEGDLIPVGDISSGNFVYDPDDSIETENNISFQFDISDSESNSFSGLSSGIMTVITTAKENGKPSQVGDNTIFVDSLSTHTFTRADFTTNTTPAYLDPEGDDAYKLKITSLPSQGQLTHNNVNVTLAQEILFTEIDSGLFRYVAPNLVLLTNFTFDFEISDVGSKQYTS